MVLITMFVRVLRILGRDSIGRPILGSLRNLPHGQPILYLCPHIRACYLLYISR